MFIFYFGWCLPLRAFALAAYSAATISRCGSKWTAWSPCAFKLWKTLVARSYLLPCRGRVVDWVRRKYCGRVTFGPLFGDDVDEHWVFPAVAWELMWIDSIVVYCAAVLIAWLQRQRYISWLSRSVLWVVIVYWGYLLKAVIKPKLSLDQHRVGRLHWCYENTGAQVLWLSGRFFCFEQVERPKGKPVINSFNAYERREHDA